MANSWGESGTTWGQGNWGEQNNFTVSGLSGLSITSGLGTPAAYAEQGWGRATWGSEIWGDSYDPVIAVSGFALTTALGTFPYAQAEDGWGRDEWGTGNWGQNTTTVVITESFGMSTALGPSGWGLAPWDEMIGWGGDLRFDTTQLSIITFDGLAITSTLNTSLTLNYDYIFGISGLTAMSMGLGTPAINNGADHSQGLASFAITSTLNSSGVVHEMSYTPSGLSIATALGTPEANNIELIDLTGFGITTTLNSSGITVADMAVGLSTLSAISSSVGAISPADVMGLTGLSFNVNLGSTGVAPLGYKDIDITGNTSYTYIEHSA
jgi:hypothetical protein